MSSSHFFLAFGNGTVFDEEFDEEFDDEFDDELQRKLLSANGKGFQGRSYFSYTSIANPLRI